MSNLSLSRLCFTPCSRLKSVFSSSEWTFFIPMKWRICLAKDELCQFSLSWVKLNLKNTELRRKEKNFFFLFSFIFEVRFNTHWKLGIRTNMQNFQESFATHTHMQKCTVVVIKIKLCSRMSQTAQEGCSFSCNSFRRVSIKNANWIPDSNNAENFYQAVRVKFDSIEGFFLILCLNNNCVYV